jgi:hypothetical protein
LLLAFLTNSGEEKQYNRCLEYLIKLLIMDVHFCCINLTTTIVEAGRKGFSVIPFKHENNLYSNELYSFFLQYRDTEFIDNNNCTMAQQAVKYCPWCGTELSILASQKEKDMAYYAARNSKMII